MSAVLLIPNSALAQPTVYLTGVFKASLENLKINQPAAARAGRNTSETRVVDDSSRIVFNVSEDLGGGFYAIGLADLRIPIASGNFVMQSGNTHIGLRNPILGRIFVGRQDAHYYNNESNMTVLAGDLRGDSISLMSFMRDGTAAIAGATRTPNIIHYTTPNWNGFTGIVAYSTGPAGAATDQPTNNGLAAPAQQSDLQNGIRKGNALFLNPNYVTATYKVGWSYWNSKPDISVFQAGNTLGSGDQLSHKVYGSIGFSGFRVGFAWDKSRVKSSTPGAGIAGVAGTTGVLGSAFRSGTVLGDRTAWSIPMSYITGPHQFHFHYTKARDDRATVGISDGAKMIALSYQYALSKRTSVGLGYAKITNDPGAAYNFFTSVSLGNSTGAGVAANEDPRFVSSTIRVAF